jgi:hypothetical protein
VFGPGIDRNAEHTLWADTYYSRGRKEIGCLIWGVLSVCFLAVGLVEGIPWWLLLVVLAGPLLLLQCVRHVPLGDVPVIVVVLASFGGVGWEFAASNFPPWTIGLIFMLYVFGYEEALSGFVKLRYLEAVARRRYDLDHRQRCDEEHLVAKRRVWGYLLATGSSAVVSSGFDSGGQYHLVLLTILAVTFLLRSRIFAAFLRLFEVTEFIGVAVADGRRWPHAMMALVNVAAYGLSLHWLVVHGNAFGGHINTPWNEVSGVDGDWFNDVETVSAALMLWLVAAFRYEWTG